MTPEDLLSAGWTEQNGKWVSPYTGVVLDLKESLFVEKAEKAWRDALTILEGINSNL